MTTRAHPWRWVFAIVLAAVLLGRAAAGFALSPAPGTLIVNTATVQYRDVNGNPLSAISNTVSVPLSGAPKLQITASADADPVAAGAGFIYTIRFENTGNASATGVTIVDTLPAGVIFQSASSGGVYSASSHTVTWNPGTLAAGSGGFLTVAVQAGAGLAVGTPLVNTASITCTEGASGSATLTTTIGAGSNLVLEKSGAPSAVPPNGVIAYTLSYRNIGNQTARGVRISDTIPAGTAYVAGSATAPGILAGSLLSWELGDIAAGGRGEVGFQVRVSPLATAGQQISNTASILSTEQTKTSNTVVTTVSTQSLLLLKMDTPDPVRAGLNLVYTLQVENTGSVPLTGVVLSDPIPIGTTFVSADSGGIAAAGARQVDWNIGPLAVGQKTTVKLTVLVDKALAEGQLIENTATATSNEMATQTVRAVSGVNARTPGKVEFYDAAWQPAYGYMSGSAVNLQVTDPDQNVDSTIAETVTIVLTDFKTGDTETLVLTETGPNTGFFRGGLTSSLGASAANDGTLTVSANSRIRATYTDALDAAPVHTASALIDPLGIVFDSVTGAPVSGSVVTLRNWNALTNTCDLSGPLPVLPPGQVNPAVPTGADGKFAFPLVPPGDFCFQVAPSTGYTFPSAVPDAGLPAGYTIGNGSRGEKFTLNVGDPPLVRDIPVDPPAGRLTITKTANKSAAAIGDLVLYTLSLSNSGSAPVTALTVTDVMPHGIVYLKGSSMMDGVAGANPQVTGARTFTWTLAGLAPGASVELAYRAVVGPDSAAGTGINTAVAAGTSLGRRIVSNTARFKIKISEGVFTTKGTIVGRVFIDREGDGLPGKDAGLADVVLYLEDGTRVVTDKRGRFSIAGIAAGTHVLRLDETTLPPGATPIPLTNRFMGDGASQFIDMTPGGLFKANFAVKKPAETKKVETPPQAPTERPGSGEAGPAAAEARSVPAEASETAVEPAAPAEEARPAPAIPGAPEAGSSAPAMTPPPASVSPTPVPVVIGAGARVSEVEPAVKTLPAPAPEAQTVATPAAEKPSKKDTAPRYTIQVGFFKNRDNALALVDELINRQATNVYQEESIKSGGIRYSIFLGRYPSLQEALKAAQVFKRNRTIPSTSFTTVLPDKAREAFGRTTPGRASVREDASSAAAVPEKAVAPVPPPPAATARPSEASETTVEPAASAKEARPAPATPAAIPTPEMPPAQVEKPMPAAETAVAAAAAKTPAPEGGEALTAGEAATTPAAAQEPALEERILTMTPDLEFLSPADRSVSTRTSIHVLLKAPLDTALTLTVNGETVDERHIGKQVQYAKGRVVVYEFVDVRLKSGEENRIASEARDPFGIVRGRKEIRVAAVGKPERIIIRTDRTEASADGQSRVGVAISLEDRNGHAIPQAAAVTVSVTAGEILEKDADPSTDGHQIPSRDGGARFTIVAPRETGAARIFAQVNDLSESADLFFIPHLRPMLFVGIGELVLGHGNASGDLGYLQNRAWFKDGTYVDGRGAFFMKGSLYQDLLITAAFDSEKKKLDELFRESDTRLDSEDKYPIYGDESKTGYEALSREKLYVKLEKDKSSLMYGDYRTDLTDTTLGAYTRAFNGLKLDVNTERLRLRAFGSYTDQSQFIDTLPGKGISGYYYLARNTIIEGSERVVIETRDRLQPSRVLGREPKSRGSDYDIDYDLGTILFKAPVPSRDADGNPLCIVVTYESRQDGKEYYVYGGRGAFKVKDWLQVGATGVVEENAIRDNQLFAGDVTLKLPGKTTVKAEYAQTRALFDIDSTTVSKTGDGWSFELESRPLERLALTGFYRELSDHFSNLSATDATRGTRKFGFDAAYELDPTLVLKAKYLDEDDRLNDTRHRLASVGAAKKFARTTLSAELSHETSDNLDTPQAQGPITPGGLLNGVPFLNAYETPNRATFAKLALERELWRDLSLTLSHKQHLDGDAFFVSQGGLAYKLNPLNRLYVREEYARYQDGTQTRTLLGVESQALKNTTAYHEYRLADGSAGHRNQQVLGLKNKFQVMEGLTANLAGEYLSTVSGRKNATEPDAFAAALGLEYLPKDDLKLTGRLEHRNEIVDDGTDSYLAEVGGAYKIHPDYALLVRERYFLEKQGGDENRTSRLLVGLAYRPLDNDRFNALGKIEYKYDKRATTGPGAATDSFIFSTEGVYQLTRAMQVMGKYAGKLEKEDRFSTYTDLVAARVMIDLTDRFDFGAEYRMLTSHRIDTRLHGGAVELGYRVVSRLWLSVGYSFDRFDEDLAGDSYRGEGPYLKLRFKFDEKTFGKSKPSAAF